MIKVINGGIYSSIQDTGRTNFQRFGVSVSGAIDRNALRIANLLVGNHQKEAAIEITFGNAVFTFMDERVISITGAHLQPKINQKSVGINKPILVSAGDTLEFQAPLFGGRSYLAIAGGFDIEHVLGSKSTYESASFGGWKGRVLQQDDAIPLGKMKQNNEQVKQYLQSTQGKVNWSVNSSDYYSFHHDTLFIRVLPGLEFDLFQQESKAHFETKPFTISNHSNRMGYHLETTHELTLKSPTDLLSEAVNFGTIQVPPSGKPMILMADSQTIGGYPKIAQVISTDLFRLAQSLPGQKIRFTFVDIKTAQEQLFKYEKYITQVESSIHYKILDE